MYVDCLLFQVLRHTLSVVLHLPGAQRCARQHLELTRRLRNAFDWRTSLCRCIELHASWFEFQVPNAVLADIPGSPGGFANASISSKVYNGFLIYILFDSAYARCPMLCWLTSQAHQAAAAASPAAGMGAGWQLHAQMQAAGLR